MEGIFTEAANLTTLGENFALDLVMYTNLWTPPFSNKELQINRKLMNTVKSPFYGRYGFYDRKKKVTEILSCLNRKIENSVEPERSDPCSHFTFMATFSSGTLLTFLTLGVKNHF